MTTSASPTAVISEDLSLRSPALPAATIEIVVGVDNLGAYKPVITLLDRLKFPNAHVTLIHSASEKLPFAPAFGSLDGIEARYAAVTTNLGELALQEASTLVGSKNLPCESHLTHGSAAQRLIAEAELVHADLVAVNAMRKEHLGANSIGSVSGALAVASTSSVLVAKGDREIGASFRAVFATDHSPFAGRCLEQFLKLAPKGIAEILVVSAWEIDDHEAEILGQNLAMLGGDVDRWVEESIKESNAKVCAKLEEAGYRARSLAVKGRPNEVIDQAMTDATADLLIIGSQGTGALSRALVGSVSLHQIISGTYPVLIIRPTSS